MRLSLSYSVGLFIGLIVPIGATGQQKQFGSFNSAAAFTIAPSGECVVIDNGTNEMIRFTREGKFLSRIGGYGWSETEFDQARDIICPNSLNIYVADYGNHRIQRYDRNLNFVSTLSLRDNEDVNRRFGYPQGVGMSRVGALFIADGENKRILKIGISNNVERVFGGVEAGAGRLSNPSKVRVSETDLVYVQDNNRIVVFDIFGNYIRMIGGITVRQIQTFTLCNDTLFIVDSSMVHILERGDRLVGSCNFTPLLGESEGPPVDIAVQGEIIYFLTKHRVNVYKIDELMPFNEGVVK